MITSDAHEQRDLPPENWAQRFVSSVAYQCPEIVAGLLLMGIGWVWWWPAGWLGAACVAYALMAATVRHIHEHQLTDPLSPDWPAIDQDITADQNVDQNGETE